MKRLLASKQYELDGLKYSDVMDVLWQAVKDIIEKYYFDNQFYEDINYCSCDEDLEPIAKAMAERFITDEPHPEFAEYAKDVYKTFYDVLYEEMEEMDYIVNGEFPKDK